MNPAYLSLAALVVALLVGVVSMQTACRDVCEKRYRVIDRECGFEPAKLDEEPACEGEVEALAQCVVDHPEAFCDYLEDLQLDNAYTGCARRAMDGAE